MCGIVGWLEFHGQQGGRDLLMRMRAVLNHRGPDENDGVVIGKVALASARLRVIDLGTGHQPMVSDEGTLWIVHNGEVYNFPELRRQLEALGHGFRSRSDTEVILRAYAEWGPECVSHLRGMFAFGIYDCSSVSSVAGGRLFLARDRVGKKPLYYYHDSERFVFASEIKALLAHPAVPRRVNHRVIPLYLAHGYVPAPWTMFDGIYELPPAHTVTVEDAQVRIRQYWDMPGLSDGESGLSDSEATEQLRGLLQEAVRLRLISDVPLGAFLSGGLDSSAVVAFMARILDEPVKTFAIGYEHDPSFDELHYARLVARACGTDHHEFIVRPDAVGLLPHLVWHHDQPFADSSALPTYLVSKLTREHVTVVLTGDGADELFAGYERFAAARLAESYRRAPQFIQATAARLFHALPESTSYGGFVTRARRFVESAPKPLSQRYLDWVGIFREAFIGELLANGATSDLNPRAHFESYFDRVREADSVRQLLYVNARTYLPGDLLIKTDRMSMANSLEARCPFLDEELLAFAARLPTNMKLRGLTTKYILKKTLEGLIPRQIIRRKKHGFGVPVGRWFRHELRDYVRDVLLSTQARRRGYFKEAAVQRLIYEHQTGRSNHGHRLWALLTFEVWHRVFIDQEFEG